MNPIRIRNTYKILWDNPSENGYLDIQIGNSSIWLPRFLKRSDGQDSPFFWHMTSLHKDFSALRRNIGPRRLLGLCSWLYLPSKLQDPFTSGAASWRRRTLFSATTWKSQATLAVVIGDWWKRFTVVSIAKLRCRVMLPALVLPDGVGAFILVICFCSLKCWIFSCKL